MSLYNMMNGVSQATFFILPMLGKHPDEYPRFRDCFTNDEEHPEYKDHIHIYTRVGGGNRGYGYGEDKLMKEEGFVTTFDDSFDSTYATYVFKVPEKFKKDYELIIAGKITETSKEYKEILYKVYPKLKDRFNQIFNMEVD